MSESKTAQFLRGKKQKIRQWIRRAREWSFHRTCAVTILDYLRKRQGVTFPLMGLCHHQPEELVSSRHHPPPRLQLSGLPVISIVTPSYNQGNMLERTIRSVLDQNYPLLQYVIQDGGSSDHSVEIIRRYQHRLHSWESRPDEGQAHALQLGFARTDGEVMGWLNSDDVLLPGSLWEIARFFQKQRQTDVLYGHRVIIDENDHRIGRWILPRNTHKYLPYADYLAQESVYWRRQIWDRVDGIDRSFQFAMDWDLFLRFWRAGARFQRLPRSIGAFRVHETQKTSSAINDLGVREMNRIRQRELGCIPQQTELSKKLIWLYWRNFAIQSAQKFRIYRAA